MKTLYVVRHAKSSWDDTHVSDFERPLNHRGSRDAPRMGRFLAEQGIRPDRLVSSPALRALTTARAIADALGYPVNDIDEEPALYDASADAVVNIVRGFADAWSSAMIFGHNPGFTSFVNTLTQSNLGNVPTCAVAKIRVQSDRWSQLGESPASLVEFYIPKEIE
jgi:phosphohistidine phosphatase